MTQRSYLQSHQPDKVRLRRAVQSVHDGLSIRRAAEEYAQTLQDGMDVGEVPGTMYGLSESGWINKEIFSDWFTFHFLNYAPPALLCYY